MAVVTIHGEDRTMTDLAEITGFLGSIGIEYERWQANVQLSADASAETVLCAYAPQIEKLKARDGYVTADVIDVNPGTVDLDAMLARFSTEHSHDEDEVRYIVAGRGIFHIHPAGGAVVGIEVGAGDLIRVPLGTLHWFNLCSDRTIRAIRLFQDRSGWVPHYTESGIDHGYQPVCLGATYIPPATNAG
jgi:1,2-dihydroxy-3-keto-5-methylthiopentene dioxygenase